jgi:hypothetical protein
MIVDAELLWTVMATMGTSSFNVLIFIAVQLFAKNSASAIDAVMAVGVDIWTSFR